MESLIRVSPDVQRALARLVRAFRWAQFVRSHPLRQGECGLVADCGIGDHLIVMALAPAVTEHYGLSIRWFAGKHQYRFLEQLFDRSFEYATWSDGDSRALRNARLSSGAFFYAHFPEKGPAMRIGRDGYHLLDLYRWRLGLPQDAPLSPRRAPRTDELERASRILAARELPAGRTVLLAIDTGTTPAGGDLSDFWSALASAIRERGWTPVINAGPKTPELPGVAALSVPLADVRAIATVAGAVVSLRSGFSDLTCDLPCRRLVVYPEVAFFSGTVREGSNFERYGLSDPPQEVSLRIPPQASDATRVADVLLSRAS